MNLKILKQNTQGIFACILCLHRSFLNFSLSLFSVYLFILHTHTHIVPIIINLGSVKLFDFGIAKEIIIPKKNSADNVQNSCDYIDDEENERI
jgi:hypothetical protein